MTISDNEIQVIDDSEITVQETLISDSDIEVIDDSEISLAEEPSTLDKVKDFFTPEEEGPDLAQRDQDIRDAARVRTSKMAEEQGLIPEEESITARDVGTAYMKGSAEIAKGVGYLLEKAGAEKIGKVVKETGQEATDYWQEAFSPQAKKKQQETYTQTGTPDDIVSTLSYIANNPGKVMMDIAGSAPASGMGMAGGAVIGKAFTLIPKIGEGVAYAMGYGLGEGAISASMGAMETEEGILEMSHAKLMEHPEYRAVFKETRDIKKSKQLVASAAAGDRAAFNMLTTTILSSPMGYVFGPILKGKGNIADDFADSFAVAVVGEGIQETTQSGAEKIGENIAVAAHADPKIKALDDVVEAMVAGGIAGMGMGGGIATGAELHTAYTKSNQEKIRIKVMRDHALSFTFTSLTPEQQNLKAQLSEMQFTSLTPEQQEIKAGLENMVFDSLTPEQRTEVQAEEARIAGVQSSFSDLVKKYGDIQFPDEVIADIALQERILKEYETIEETAEEALGKKEPTYAEIVQEEKKEAKKEEAALEEVGDFFDAEGKKPDSASKRAAGRQAEKRELLEKQHGADEDIINEKMKVPQKKKILPTEEQQYKGMSKEDLAEIEAATKTEERFFLGGESPGAYKIAANQEGMNTPQSIRVIRESDGAEIIANKAGLQKYSEEEKAKRTQGEVKAAEEQKTFEEEIAEKDAKLSPEQFKEYETLNDTVTKYLSPKEKARLIELEEIREGKVPEPEPTKGLNKSEEYELTKLQEKDAEGELDIDEQMRMEDLEDKQLKAYKETKKEKLDKLPIPQEKEEVKKESIFKEKPIESEKDVVSTEKHIEKIKDDLTRVKSLGSRKKLFKHVKDMQAKVKTFKDNITDNYKNFTDEEKLANQDFLDSQFQERAHNISNDLGLFKDEMKKHIKFTHMGAGKNVVGIEIYGVEDNLQDYKQFLKEVEQAKAKRETTKERIHRRALEVKEEDKQALDKEKERRKKLKANPQEHTSAEAKEIVIKIIGEEIPVVLHGVEKDITYSEAYQSRQGISMSPEIRARSIVKSYAEGMAETYKHLKQYAKTEEQQETLDTMFATYRDGMVKRKKLMLARDSRVMSTMITGPANFPVRSNQKKSDSAHKALEDLVSYDTFMTQKIKNKLTGKEAIKSTDEDAVEKLEKKLKALTEAQEKMKTANKIIRSKKLTEEEKINQLQKELKFSEKDAKELVSPSPQWRTKPGFASYSLTNNNAKIKATKQRIASIEKMHERAETIGTEEILFDGGKLVQNYEIDRVQFFFDGKPSEEIRTMLKKNGFRYSPKNNHAWQRQITHQAQYKAKTILAALKEFKYEEAEAGEVSRKYTVEELIENLETESFEIKNFTENKIVTALFKFGDKGYSYSTGEHRVVIGETAGLTKKEVIKRIEHEIVHFKTIGFIAENRQDKNVVYVESALQYMKEHQTEILNKLSPESRKRVKYVLTRTAGITRLAEGIAVLGAESETANDLYKVLGKEKGNLRDAIITLLRRIKNFIIRRKTIAALQKEDVNYEKLIAAISQTIKQGSILNEMAPDVARMARTKAIKQMPSRAKEVSQFDYGEFKSKIETTLEAKMPKVATIAHVKGMLKDINKDEMKWSGLEEYLNSKNDNDKVIKKEILREIKLPELESVTLGGKGTNTADLPKTKDDFEIYDTDEGTTNYQKELGDTTIYADEDSDGIYIVLMDKDYYKTDLGNFETWNDAIEGIKDADEEGMFNTPGSTKFKNYTTEGIGTNYREELVVLTPEAKTRIKKIDSELKVLNKERDILFKDEKGDFDFFRSLDNKETPEAKARITNANKIDALEKEKESLLLEEDTQYKSGHWDKPNVLYHTRKQDAKIDGDNTLLVEEIQSDWHQEGRKKGYKSNRITANQVEAVHHKGEQDGSPGYWESRVKETGELILRDRGGITKKEAIKEAVHVHNSLIGEKGVPQAPYAKTWHEKAMKDIIAEAVEKNYGRVAWVAGKEQADRYSLAKQIDELDLHEKEGVFTIYARKGGHSVFSQDGLSEKQIEDYVGKEAARKLLKQKPSEYNQFGYSARSLSGMELEVGGEGMKTFYDSMLPKWTNKYIKKYDSKVEVKKLDNGQEVWSFEVTPKMKEQITKEGQPLYGSSLTPSSTMRPGFIHLGDMANLPFELTGMINKAKNVLDTVVSQKVTGKIKGTKLDDFIRRIGGSQAGLGLLTRSQEQSFVRHFRSLQRKLAKADISAEEKAKLIDESQGRLTDDVFNQVSIQYLENPEARGVIESEFPELAEELKRVREYISNLSLEAMERGLILPSQFEKWKDRYLSRLYLLTQKPQMASRLASGIKLYEQKAGRKIDSIVDYLMENPEEAARLGAVLDIDMVVKTTIAKTQGNIGLEEFMRGITERSEIVSSRHLVTIPFRVENLPTKFSPIYAKETFIPYLQDMIARLDKSTHLSADMQEIARAEAGILKLEKIIELAAERAEVAQSEISLLDDKTKATLPKDKRYGVLSGLPVSKDVASLVISQFNVVNNPEMLTDGIDTYGAKFLSYFKWAKVPANVFAYPRNFASNAFQWTMSGADPAQFGKEYARAAFSMYKRDKWHRIAREAGVLDTNAISAEVNNALKIWSEGIEEGSFLKKKTLAIMQNVGDYYGLIDDVAKIARIRYAVEKEGKSIEEAVEIAQNTHYDYSLTYDIIRAMRDPNMTRGAMLKIIGTVFPTYTQKTVAYVYDTMLERPVTFALMNAALYMFLHGDDDETREEIGAADYDETMDKLPDWIKYNPMARVDMKRLKDGTIDVTIVDLAYIIPYGTLNTAANNLVMGTIEGDFKRIGTGIGGIGLGGSPIMMLGDFIANKSTFTGKTLYYEHDTMQFIKDTGMYGFKQLGPGTFTKLYSLSETRHPIVPRLVGLNTYVYNDTDLESMREGAAKRASTDAAIRGSKYKRLITDAKEEYRKGNITKEERDAKIKKSQADVEHWEDLGQKAFDKISSRSKEFKAYSAEARDVRRAFREYNALKRKAKKDKSYAEEFFDIKSDPEKMLKVRKKKIINKVGRETKYIKKQREKILLNVTGDAKRKQMMKVLDERERTMYNRAYKALTKQ